MPKFEIELSEEDAGRLVEYWRDKVEVILNTAEKQICRQLESQLSRQREDEVEKQELTCGRCGRKYEVELPKGAKITSFKCSCSRREDEVEELAIELYQMAHRISSPDPKPFLLEPWKRLARHILENYEKKEEK